jgi:hypothetical protein
MPGINPNQYQTRLSQPPEPDPPETIDRLPSVLILCVSEERGCGPGQPVAQQNLNLQVLEFQTIS